MHCASADTTSSPNLPSTFSNLDGHDPRGCAIEDRKRCCAMSSAPPVAPVSWRSTTSPAADSSSLPRWVAAARRLVLA